MTEYSAIILAGGKSSRMGRKKAELVYQGKTFIDIIIGKLRELNITDIMISGYDQLKAHTTYVEDVCPGKGPLAGIHAGLLKAVSPSVIVLTEDAPLVPVEYIRKLMAEHEKHSSAITVSECDGKLQQLPGIYEKSLAPLCEQILKSDKPKILSLIEAEGCVRVPFCGAEAEIRGYNTPEEYKKLLDLKREN